MRGLTGYDLVLIDCRPSVGRLTTNALVAAHRALIVAEPERAAIRGIARCEGWNQSLMGPVSTSPLAPGRPALGA